MEQQHLHAKWSLYPENVEEEEEEVGLQRRVSTPIKNVPEDGGEESDSSRSRSNQGNDGELEEEDPVSIQDVKDGVVNATNEKVQEEPKPKAEPERELEPENEAETDEILTKEEYIKGSAMEKGEVGLDEEEHVTSDFNSAVGFANEKGLESIQAYHETESSGVEKSVSKAEHVYETFGIGEEISDAQKVHSSQILHQHKKILEVDDFTFSKLPSFTESHDEPKPLGSGNGIREDVDIDVIEEVWPEETEFDVERVLEKQNTHDLFCPNCHSCITRRVILHRKKRKIRNGHRAEYDGLDKVVVSGLDAESTVQAEVSSEVPTESIPVSTTDGPTARVADHNNNRDPEVFTCLSCLSFFIPTGSGLKLLKILHKDKAPKVTDQQEKVPEQGEDVIVDIERGQADATVARQQPESTTAVEEAVPPQVVVHPDEDDQPIAQAQETRDWDILKSIVYGGLIESITSLGIVSSAAGGGAETLNTLALGLANLIGGLFIVAHNLRELKESSVTSSGSTVQDRYFQQLGRRDKFWLHATVAIISFIIFGSVAPITYAFSFRESDNRDYKLAVVAAASLFCILMLAIGKAHVRTPPRSYFKTISYYIISGLMASGVSFLVGELLDYLLEKLGWFDTSSTVTGPILEMGTTGSGWASY